MVTKDLGKVVPEKGVDYMTAEEIAQFKTEIEADLQSQITTNADNITTANGKITTLQSVTGTGTDTFSAESTYAVGDIVIKDNKVYRCITAITTAGAWDSTKWEEISVRQEQDEQNARIQELEYEKDLIISNYDTNTATKENGEKLVDSLNGFVQDITIKGKTYQANSIYGKNLFDKDSATYKYGQFINTSGVITSSSVSGYTTSYVEVNPETSYTIQGTLKSSGSQVVAIYYYNESKEWISRDSFSASMPPITFTTPALCKYIQFQFQIDVYTGDDVMIEEGTTASDYEIYTNGSPAPTTSNASQIKNVSGDIKIELRKKNIFDLNNYNVISAELANGQIRSHSKEKIIWIPCKPYTLYSFTKIKTPSYNRMTFASCKSLPAIGEDYYNYYAASTSSTTETYRTGAGAKYLLWWCYNSSANMSMDDFVKSLQIEEAESPTDYEEYTGKKITFPLSLGQKMYEGDYLADDGIHHVRGQHTFDGTETINASTSYNTTDYYCYRYLLADGRKSPNQVFVGDLKCTHLKQNTWTSVYSTKRNEEACATSVDNKNVYMKVSYSSVEAFKQWLATLYANNTPLIVEYFLEEEAIEPYTEAQQTAWNQIKRLQTYKPITNIVTSSNDLAPDIKIKYLQNPLVGVQSDITSLQAQILELAGGE